MILDQRNEIWRATFTSSATGLPRVEVFHHGFRRALEIGQACERVVRRKFPGDFPREARPASEAVKEAMLGLIGASFVVANVATGTAAVLNIAGH